MGWGSYENWPSSQFALAHKGKNCHDRLHSHCEKVISALNGIKDRKDWTMEVALHKSGLRYKRKPFDLSSRNFQCVWCRITSLELDHTLDVFEECWIMSLLQSTSDNLKSLTITHEQPHAFFRYARIPALTHLVIQRSSVPPLLF